MSGGLVVDSQLWIAGGLLVDCWWVAGGFWWMLVDYWWMSAGLAVDWWWILNYGDLLMDFWWI